MARDHHGTATISITGIAGAAALFGAAQIGGPSIVAPNGSAVPAQRVRANIVLYFAIPAVMTGLSRRRLLTPFDCRIGIDHGSPLWGLGVTPAFACSGSPSEIAVRPTGFALIAAAITLSVPVLDNFRRQGRGQ
jgi:hypothetical protein